MDPLWVSVLFCHASRPKVSCSGEGCPAGGCAVAAGIATVDGAGAASSAAGAFGSRGVRGPAGWAPARSARGEVPQDRFPDAATAGCAPVLGAGCSSELA